MISMNSAELPRPYTADTAYALHHVRDMHRAVLARCNELRRDGATLVEHRFDLGMTFDPGTEIAGIHRLLRSAEQWLESVLGAAWYESNHSAVRTHCRLAERANSDIAYIRALGAARAAYRNLVDAMAPLTYE